MASDTNNAGNIRNTLDEYAWNKRQLIVFTPDIDHPQYQVLQKTLVDFNKELKERYLHTWHVVADDKVKLGSAIRDDVNNKDFRAYYSVTKDQFRLLLIGYDQGEKLRLQQANIDSIFSAIDQMPMRIQELDNQ